MSNRNLFLYLTTRGWRTGNAHTIEIWFVPLDGRYYLISERNESHWVQNLRHQPEVTFRLGTRVIEGRARIVQPEAERELHRRVTALFDIKYGWSEGLVVELTPRGHR